MRAMTVARRLQPSAVSRRLQPSALGRALLLVLAAGSPASAQPALTGAINPPLSPRNANYTIDARLAAASRTITGSELITWRNITSHAAGELQFHLYWNAWRSERSTFMREDALGGGPRSHAPGDWAYI